MRTSGKPEREGAWHGPFCPRAFRSAPVLRCRWGQGCCLWVTGHRRMCREHVVSNWPSSCSQFRGQDRQARWGITQHSAVRGPRAVHHGVWGPSLKPQCHFPTCQMHSCPTVEGRAAITATNLKLVHSFHHHRGQNESLDLIYVNIEIIKTAHIFLPNNFSCGIHLEEIKRSLRDVCIKLGFFSWWFIKWTNTWKGHINAWS